MPQPVSVAIQPDPFKGRMDVVASYIPQYETDREIKDPTNAKAKAAQGAGFDLDEARFIPRPLLGVQVKPNTPAFAQVVKSDGTLVSLLNYERTETQKTDGKATAASPPVQVGDSLNSPDTSAKKAWTQWFLQSVREERMEKTQLIETFGEPYFYAFGEKPRSLMFSGVLMNTEDYNWRAIFWQNWDQNFRATRLIQNDARMYITFDDILVEGYPVSATANQVADTPNIMVFSFSLFVTNYTNLSTLANGSLRASSRPPALESVRSPEQVGDELLLERTNQELLRLARGMGAGLLDAQVNAMVSEGGWSKVGGLALRETGYLVRDLALRGRTQSAQQVQERAAYAVAELVANTTSLFGGGLALQASGLTETEFNAWFGETTWLAESLATAATGVDSDGALPFSLDSTAQAMRGGIYRGLAPARPHALT